MDTVEVLKVCHHFVSSMDNSVNGLYEIKLNNDKVTIFRNGNSWGVLSHYLGNPVTKCIGFLRQDKIELVEKAVDEFLGEKLDKDCDSCICNDCNENCKNVGECEICSSCKEKPIMICPINKYRDDYGEGQGN